MRFWQKISAVSLLFACLSCGRYDSVTTKTFMILAGCEGDTQSQDYRCAQPVPDDPLRLRFAVDTNQGLKKTPKAWIGTQALQTRIVRDNWVEGSLDMTWGEYFASLASLRASQEVTLQVLSDCSDNDTFFTRHTCSPEISNHHFFLRLPVIRKASLPPVTGTGAVAFLPSELQMTTLLSSDSPGVLGLAVSAETLSPYDYGASDEGVILYYRGRPNKTLFWYAFASGKKYSTGGFASPVRQVIGFAGARYALDTRGRLWQNHDNPQQGLRYEPVLLAQGFSSAAVLMVVPGLALVADYNSDAPVRLLPSLQEVPVPVLYRDRNPFDISWRDGLLDLFFAEDDKVVTWLISDIEAEAEAYEQIMLRQMSYVDGVAVVDADLTRGAKDYTLYRWRHYDLFWRSGTVLIYDRRFLPRPHTYLSDTGRRNPSAACPDSGAKNGIVICQSF